MHDATTILRGFVSLSILANPHLQGRSARIVHWSYAFSLFTSLTAHTVNSYDLLKQQYADDTQLYVAISKDNYDTPVVKLELCLSTLHTWFCYNDALIPDKSEEIVFRTTQRSRSIQITSTINVADTLVQVSNQVSILVVTLDSKL